LPQTTGHGMNRRTELLKLVVCLALCCSIGGIAIVWWPDDLRGIGDLDQAMLKVQEGMTKDEVRVLLGRPQRVEFGEGTGSGVFGDGWYYREQVFGGSYLIVHFGPDDRVVQRYFWVD